MQQITFSARPVFSRSAVRGVLPCVGRLLAAIVCLCTACASAQSLDGALLDLHVNGGGVQRYRLVAEQTPDAQNEPTAPSTQSSSTTPPGDEQNAQNEPNANPGGLSFTFASPSAPAAVHANAMEIPLGPGNTPLNVKYDWDFGDPKGKYNTLSGFNAAHVYEQPGKYVVTLRITDSRGAVHRFGGAVNVLADTRRTVYAESSNFDAALKLLADDTRFLLKRGQRYVIPRTITLEAGNVLIGAYGEGADPVLIWSGKASGVMLTTSSQSRDVMIQNLAFDALDSNARSMAIRPQGRNLTVRNCTFANVDYAINNNAQPKGVFALDNVAPDHDSIQSYFSWVAGEDHVYLGNAIANSLKAHIIRMNHYSRVLVAKNDFTNHTFGGVTVQEGTFAYVAQNTTHDCEITAAPLGGADGIKQDPTAGSVRASWVVIEENHVIDDSINVGHGAQHVMVRNNRVDRDKNTAYNIGGWDATYGRGIEDVWLIDNLAVNHGETGRFLKIEGNPLNDGTPQVTVSGNVYIAPNLQPGASSTAIVYVVGKDLRCFREIAGNIWPVVNPLPYAQGGVHYVWPKWSDAQGYRTPEEWRDLGAKDERYENVRLNNE